MAYPKDFDCAYFGTHLYGIHIGEIGYMMVYEEGKK